MSETSSAQKETFGFQTEVAKLLDLMINSLYSDKEIFLRELISNASDAAGKLRFAALENDALLQGDSELKIHVEFDKDAKTITVRDNGIGMNRDEVIENLGTIAKSGTEKFLKSLSGDQSKDSQLIGQFGVGFYASFMVADRIVVITRKAGDNADQAVRWESAGTGEFSVEPTIKEGRGTDIILHLKDAETELLDNWKLRNIVSKYSDHIDLPILMLKSPELDDEGKPKEGQTPEFEQVNKATALWTRSKDEVSDEEYKEFYKTLSYDFQEPLKWIHKKVEGNQEYTSLLYIPSQAPFDLFDRERQSGLKLFIQRVFIMDNAEFLPSYLRFIKGVIDSNDLPLNVSREILQNNRTVDKIRAATVKAVLSTLDKMAKNDAETYQKFWEAFGNVLKEGPGEDTDNKEQLAKLMRFSSTHTDSTKQTVSFADYIERMKDGQDEIYYIVAESFPAAQNNPHLEIFRQKGIEVLLLTDRVDEWFTAHLTEVEGKKLQSVAKGDLDLSKFDDEETKEAQQQQEKDFESVIKQMKDVLGETVKDVRVTHRLTDSPACVVADDAGMSMHLQRMMSAAGQNMPALPPIFEINPTHRLISRLREEQDDTQFAEWTHLLFEQAQLAESGQLADPATFVKRMNQLL